MDLIALREFLRFLTDSSCQLLLLSSLPVAIEGLSPVLRGLRFELITAWSLISYLLLWSLSFLLLFKTTFYYISFWFYLLREVIICFVLFSNSVLLVYKSLFFCSIWSQYILSSCSTWMSAYLHEYVLARKINTFVGSVPNCYIPV